jgi:hypothetical protein
VFKSVLNDRVTELNLAAFLEHTRSKKGQDALLASTAKADLLVLTSTELDDLGEGTSTVHLNQIPLIVQQIQQAIRRCQELNFHLAVIATDHGFLWVEDTDNGSVCEKPPGDWPLVKRRCLIGQGDGESGVLKLAPTQLGIPTTEAAYVTPRALATFSKGTGYFHVCPASFGRWHRVPHSQYLPPRLRESAGYKGQALSQVLTSGIGHQQAMTR